MRFPGDVSSQFISGLLFALPLCREDSDIRLTTPLESAAYVRMTLETLARSGIRVEETRDGWHIPGGQSYRPVDTRVEGDWSQAAFLLAAGALGGEVILTGLNRDSAQGDRAAWKLFRDFGAEVDWVEDTLRCRRAALRGIEIDASQIPDLVPVLAAVAALAEGTTVIRNAARLRLKESDRLAATAQCLALLGGPGGGTARRSGHPGDPPAEGGAGSRLERSPHRHEHGRGRPGMQGGCGGHRSP